MSTIGAKAVVALSARRNLSFWNDEANPDDAKGEAKYRVIGGICRYRSAYGREQH
jgi:hypothetical protein